MHAGSNQQRVQDQVQLLHLRKESIKIMSICVQASMRPVLAQCVGSRLCLHSVAFHQGPVLHACRGSIKAVHKVGIKAAFCK